MQLITLNGVAVNAFPEDYEIALLANRTCVCDPANKNNDADLAGITRSNAMLHTGVELPEDFIGGRYFFDGKTFTPNPEWVNPFPQPVPQAEELEQPE